MIKNCKQAQRYMFGRGALAQLDELIAPRRESEAGYAVFFVDHYFKGRDLVARLPVGSRDKLLFVDTVDEPKTSGINALVDALAAEGRDKPCVVLGVGGGATMDTAKAVANLLTNGGRAEDYQGWDLVKHPGVFKIAVPTLSGTGAETSRTCVMTNAANGLKLGMNSDFTIYDQLLLDPDLTATVPRNQYLYTGMDTYIHCIESLHGRYRNAIGDAFSDQALKLCDEVFNGGDMMGDESREKLMIASYLGGCAIANSFVGLVHPLSAGLSVVLGVHHCVGNCIALAALEEFYPREVKAFWSMLEKQGVDIPRGVCRDLDDAQYDALYNASIVHEKPLANALGDGFRDILTRDKVVSLFRKM
jgi:3-deoxy-alpha-D-manno-octulosonate 8-oxidase